MSRTYRDLQGMHSGALRFPHTFNEIRNLSAIMSDDDLQDFTISKRNRISSRFHNIPTAWDDQIVSGYYQSDYKYPYKYAA
jgi:hypothetical protein